MGLSVNFSRKSLCARKTAIGIELIAPTTIVNALSMKLSLGDKRKNNKVAEIIRINEKNVKIQHRHTTHVIRMQQKCEQWNNLALVEWADSNDKRFPNICIKNMNR